MKNSKRLIINAFIILIAIAYVAVLALGNVFIDKVSIATVSGSYAESYGKANGLQQATLADTQKAYFDQRYESFDYNLVNSGIDLRNYKGISTTLVIPATIGGKPVVSLGEGFIASLKTVKKLCIPQTIVSIAGEPEKSITICCNEDSVFYKKNKESAWSFDLVYDSDFVNYFTGDISFNYNMNGSSAEIVSYTGEYAPIVVIPSYINGYPVTKISMDMNRVSRVIVIPETVTEITGTSVKYYATPLFIMEVVFSVIAFVLALIAINIILPKYKTGNDYMIRGNQIVIVVLYLILQVGFSIASIYFNVASFYISLVVSLIIMILFIGAIMLTNRGVKQVADVEARIAQKTSHMKNIKELAKGLSDGIDDPELKKRVRRLEEEIRFSDPVSSPELEVIESDLEKDLAALKNAVNEGNSDAVIELSGRLEEKVKTRNRMCKAGK